MEARRPAQRRGPFHAELIHATFLAFKGIRTQVGSATPIVGAYLERKALAEMGYTMPVRDENPFLLDCFLIIDSELKRLSQPEKP